MLDIDLLTTYVICGAASCAGALMTMLVRTSDAGLAGALRTASAGFGLLGLSLLQLVFGVSGPTSPPMLLALAGTTVGLGILGQGLARLAGTHLSGPLVAGVIGAALLAQGLALQAGALALSVAYTGSLTLMCAGVTWGVRGFLLRPRHVAECLIGLSMLGFLLSYGLRMALALAHEGPASIHHAYGPPAVLRLLGIQYGVMPVVVATLLLSVVNTRLAAQISHQAMTDELTGAMNRRALRQQAPGLVSRSLASGESLAALLLDIDHFKQVNDTRGHAVGDEVLRQVVEVLRSQLRPEALVTRFGGEEFALLVPVRDAAAAQRVAERLRATLAAHDIAVAGPPLRVTTSIGLAMLGPDEPLESALRRADQALYLAKQGGRNRVEVAGPG